jgi:Galactose oxidase, central domain
MGAAFARTFEWKVIATGSEGPGPRSRHGLVYDLSAGVNILFGGIRWASCGILLGDTWELRNGRWSQIQSVFSPAARHRTAFAHDARRSQSVLFGGQGRQGNKFLMLGDTWIYASGQWQQLKTSSGPTPRCGHALVYDEESGLTVLFGGIAPGDRSLGDTWVFDGSAWQPVTGLAPDARRYAAFGFDPDLRGCILNGGSEDDHGKRSFDDSWLFRDRSWMRLPNDFDTDVHDDHALAYHQTAQRLAMFGGLGGPNNVKVLEANGWRAVEAGALPARHQCSPLAWNERLAGLVMHGGEIRHGGPQLNSTCVLRVREG